jgi:exodeoxyribonuclease VII small subunit
LEKKSKSEKKIKTKNFEEALQALEEIALKLENGTLGLEDSISKYEEGINYARFCQDKLKEAERKIEILQKGEDQKVTKKNIPIKEDSGEVKDDEDLQGSLL